MTGPQALPDHVKNHLIQTGKLTTQGLGRRAQLQTCTRCPALVIVGLDSHRCALRAVCDPVALDQLGEALELIAGRATYELWGRELERRDQWKISGGMPRPVIPEHECRIKRTTTPEILQLFKAPYPADDSDLEVPF